MAMEPKEGPFGTKEAPRMIPSHCDTRIVGICTLTPWHRNLTSLPACCPYPVAIGGLQAVMWAVCKPSK